MPIFRNIFGCNSQDDINNSNDVERRINALETKYDILENRINNDMKRIEDKIDNKFEILNNKIDNLILILNRPRNQL